MGSSRVKTFVGVSLVVFAFILAHSLGVLQPVEGILQKIITVFSGAAYRITRDGSKDLDALSEKTVRMVAATLLEEENAALREQLGFFKRKPLEHIGAEVIGRNAELIGNTIIINRGNRNGILKGQPVIVDDGVLIGKIVRVDEKTAIVQLLSDGQSKVAATIMNRDRSIGIVEGGYGMSVRMNFIPQHEEVLPGDIVITSGLEKDIPHGLVIGTVEAVEKEAYQPFQRAVLTTQAKLDRIVLVSVVIAREKNL